MSIKIVIIAFFISSFSLVGEVSNILCNEIFEFDGNFYAFDTMAIHLFYRSLESEVPKEGGIIVYLI